MLPDIVLFVVVTVLLTAGTRLALARPAYGLPVLRSDDERLGAKLAGLATGAVCTVTIALTVPQWEIFTEITAVIVVFPLSAARSWPARAVVLLMPATARTAWLLEENRVICTAAAAFFAVAFAAVIRPRVTFRTAAAAGTVFAARNLIGVSVTHAAVRAAAADPFAGLAAQGHTSGAGVPGLTGIPAHAALLSPHVIAAGAGDVVLPGILIAAAGRAGRLAGTQRLCAAAVAGYGAALAACLAAAAVPGVPLPATVFLVPGVIIAVAAAARQGGVWPALAAREPRSPAAVPGAAQPPDPGAGEPGPLPGSITRPSRLPEKAAP